MNLQSLSNEVDSCTRVDSCTASRFLHPQIKLPILALSRSISTQAVIVDKFSQTQKGETMLGGNLPDVDMCPLHLSQGGSTILMLSSVILKGYELLAYTTTGALGTGFRYS